MESLTLFGRPPVPETIAITGASRGIGRALAIEYADAGRTLFLSARKRERLQDTAEDCRAFGAAVETAVVDVTDADAVRSWLLDAETVKPIDLLIANAGVSSGTGPNREPETEAGLQKLFDVNFQGVVNTIQPIMPLMAERKRGQIALITSAAGYRGVPQSPGYAASKAAARVYGEGLRAYLAEDGVFITVVSPGYVETDMSGRLAGPRPFLISAEKAALIIRRGLAAGRGDIVFPFAFRLVPLAVSLLPARFGDRLLRRYPYGIAEDK